MLELLRTNSNNKNFIELVKLLDAYLAELDGTEHAFYNELNKISNLKYAVVAYKNNKPVACGAMKEFAADTLEIKRMFTKPSNRGEGIAAKILTELEIWAAELSYKKCILETGKRQPEAINLYERNGYKRILNYGKYAGIKNSICFEKNLNDINL